MSRALVALGRMAELQDGYNRQVDPDWRSAGFAYYRAIWVECAELLDHYGWKWWKHQQPDLDQVRLELIDIWHFGLSQLLIAAPPATGVDLRDAVEALAAGCLATRSFSPAQFKALMDALPMDFDELARGYLGKNVLNLFRLAHGYRDGSYRKHWGGREDNEHLVELVADLDPGADDFSDRLHAALAERYAAG